MMRQKASNKAFFNITHPAEMCWALTGGEETKYSQISREKQLYVPETERVLNIIEKCEATNK